MDIHFVRGGPSYLPELDAYRDHVASRGWGCVVHDRADTVPANAEVVWWICGRVSHSQAWRLSNAFHVHEYASASVPPWASLKDAVKRWTHPRPHHRVFQSEWVRQHMGFDANVPYSVRDMGVPQAFLDAPATSAPEFDLVYLGETSRLSEFLQPLATLLDAHLSLLVVGSVAPQLQTVLAHFANVMCIGRIPQADVPAQLLRARAGLNVMPARLPFKHQTSTKALEYLAVGLPVVSNDYPWIRQAAAQYEGRVRIVSHFDVHGWKAALDDLPALQSDRSALRPLTWEARLAGLPAWDAIAHWQQRSRSR